MFGLDDLQKEVPRSTNLILEEASLFKEVAGFSRFANQRNREGLFVGGNNDHLLLGEFLGAQGASFGTNLTNSEIIQLLRQGAGKVYFAYDESAQNRIGYAFIQTRELDEKPIQVELDVRHSANLFHDHLDYGLPKNTVLFADLGIIKDRQNEGLGSILASRVKESFETRYGKPFWMLFARFNNPSLIIATKILGMSMIGIQGPKPVGITRGSNEDNFRGDTIIPALKELPKDCGASPVVSELSLKPHDVYWFLPWKPGEQTDLDSTPWVSKLLRQTMAYGRKPSPDGEDYAMRRVCSAEELIAAGFINLPKYDYFLLFKKIEESDFGFETE